MICDLDTYIEDELILYANKNISDTNYFIEWFKECRDNNITPYCIMDRFKYTVKDFDNSDERYLSFNIYSIYDSIEESYAIKTSCILICRKPYPFKKPYKIIRFYKEV